MSLSSKPPPKWRRISLSTNGREVSVRYSDMNAIDMVNMFYGALEKIPHACASMELALENFKNSKNNNNGIEKSGS